MHTLSARKYKSFGWLVEELFIKQIHTTIRGEAPSKAHLQVDYTSSLRMVTRSTYILS